MTSISHSDYRYACSLLIRDALRVPRMYFRSLTELERLLDGHRMAFQQIAGINQIQSFNMCFADWIYRTTGTSGSGGWAYAIVSLSSDKDEQSEKLFAELVEKFFAEWQVPETSENVSWS